MKVTITLIAAVVVGIAAVPCSAEPVVVNPSFEGGVNNGHSYEPVGWSPLSSPGVAVVNYGGALEYNGSFWDNGLTTDGTHVLILEAFEAAGFNANEVFTEQTINGFGIGATYEVTFSYNARTVSSDTPTLNVYMDDGLQFSDAQFTPVDNQGVQATPFYAGSFEFQATSTSHTLKFEAVTDGPVTPFDESVFVDDIAITAVIPEPGTFVLASLALCGLLCWRRRRRS